MIEVINYHRDKDKLYDAVYIGRRAPDKGWEGSPLANPYVVKPWGPYERGETIELYEEWLENKLLNRDYYVRAEMNRLWRMATVGDLRLMCYCAPKACHGDVIKKMLEAKLGHP